MPGQPGIIYLNFLRFCFGNSVFYRISNVSQFVFGSVQQVAEPVCYFIFHVIAFIRR